MKSKLLLRIASGLVFLHTLGHSIGTATWKTGPDKTIQGVIDSMNNNKFLFMGANRSFGDFYEGFSISMIFVLLMITIVLWVVSDETNNSPHLAAKVLMPVMALLATLSMVEFIYFFLFAAIISLLAALCTGIALFQLLKHNNLLK